MFAEQYDQWADRYVYMYGAPEEGMAYFERTVGQHLTTLLENGGRVLDVGCGVGLSTAGLLAHGYEVVGLDISAHSLELAAGYLKPYKGRFELVEGDALALDAYADSFDAIIAISGLCDHFLTEEAQQKLLQGFAKAVKPNGYVILDSYDHENLFAGDAEDGLIFSTVAPLPEGPAVYMERRRYNGMPRSRNYETEYILIDDRDEVMRLKMPGRAMLLREYIQTMKLAGMADCRWFAPSETGYHKYIFTARRPAEDGAVEKQTAEDDPNRDNHRMVAKIKPSDLPPNIFEEAPGYRRQTLHETRNENGQKVYERRKQATLVMFSGGVDSACSLAKLLRESDDDIVAHHIHFINVEGRQKAEAIACQRIVEYLKRTERDFIYTESSIDRRRFRSFGMDEVAVGFEVGIVSRSFAADRGYGIDRWTSGICLEEELDDFGVSDVDQMQHALNCAAASAHPGRPPRYFQLKIVSKRDQIEYMGKALTEMCWTCRRPVRGKDGEPGECGACRTCLVMNDIRAGRPTIAEGAADKT